MKRFILLFLILFKSFFACAQQGTIPRLKYRLSLETNDTTKAFILDSLSMYYLFYTNKQDSSFYYASQFIDHSFRLTDKKYLVLAYARMGFYYVNINQNKAALEISLKGLKLAEQNNIRSYLSSLYYNISWVYFNLGDHASGLNNVFEAIHYLNDDRDPFFDQPLHVFGLAGNIYLDKEDTDSAFTYFRMVDSINVNSKELGAKEVTNFYWALYYLNKGDYQKTDSIIPIGIASCEKNGDFLLSNFLLFYAQTYVDRGQINRAIKAAQKAFKVALSVGDKSGAKYAAFILQDCFKKSGNLDSAYFYLNVKDSLKSLIASTGNLNEIQQAKFNEQLGQKEEEADRILKAQKERNKIALYIFITALIFFLMISFIQWRNNKHKQKANALLQHQKDKVESTLSELRAAQSQLIQSEKMASLGELTAGIAHEIQNPLNFINNFSELNTELIVELEEALGKRDQEEVHDLAKNIRENEQKINHHGKRADGIVKGMLQHSRSSSGVKEPTDINALADEYLRMAYHGLRAKDKSFNATMHTEFDPAVGLVNVIPQDIGRVILNLVTNAFYVVDEKKKASADKTYEPTVSVTTKLFIPPSGGPRGVMISVKDNGNGIPKHILDKIFQPFFTTKPTGQGTGLGLSLSYDIVKAHGGQLEVETEEGKGSTFIIKLLTD